MQLVLVLSFPSVIFVFHTFWLTNNFKEREQEIVTMHGILYFKILKFVKKSLEKMFRIKHFEFKRRLWDGGWIDTENNNNNLG